LTRYKNSLRIFQTIHLSRFRAVRVTSSLERFTNVSRVNGFVNRVTEKIFEMHMEILKKAPEMVLEPF
jgi:hypothetical protein